jgi:hypothetical protein
VDIVDTIHSPICIVDHRYEYMLENCFAIKNDLQMNCKEFLRI